MSNYRNKGSEAARAGLCAVALAADEMAARLDAPVLVQGFDVDRSRHQGEEVFYSRRFFAEWEIAVNSTLMRADSQRFLELCK